MEKGSGIGIAIGFVIAAIALAWATEGFAVHRERTCNSYSWCLDWTQNPFFLRSYAPLTGSATGKGGKP